MERQSLKMCLDLTAHVVKHFHMDVCSTGAAMPNHTSLFIRYK